MTTLKKTTTIPVVGTRSTFRLCIEIDGKSRLVEAEVMTMPVEAWEKIDEERGHPWSAKIFDDGRVMAVRAWQEGNEGGENSGQDEPWPERIGAMRRFRADLMEALEGMGIVQNLTMYLDGEGGASFDVGLNEANPRFKRPFYFGAKLRLEPDPEAGMI